MNLEYLINFRKANSKTQVEFARSIGCPQSTYHYVETGRTQLDALQLKTLCEKYKGFDLFTFLEITNNFQKLIDKFDLAYNQACANLDVAKQENEDLKKKVNDLTLKLDALKDTALDLLLEERKRK